MTDFTIFSYLIVLWCLSHCPMLSSFLVLSLKFTALTFQGLKDMPSAPGPLAYDNPVMTFSCVRSYPPSPFGMLFFASCQAPEVRCFCGCCYSFVVNLFRFMLLGLSLAPLIWTFTSSGDFKTFSSHFFECLFHPGLISFNPRDTEGIHPSYFVDILQLF